MKTQKDSSKFTETEALFLPLVSHDIKSLSNAIHGASQALSAQLHQSGLNNEAELREFVQLIACASNRLKPIIGDLVAIGKAQANSATIQPVAVYNLRQELECARDTFSYEALAKNIDLSLTITDDIPLVYCDISNLRSHVLNNILSNAIRFTPVGGKVNLRVEQSAQDMMVIKISDSGLGIPNSERASLFRQYLKSEKYRAATASNRGVGLHNAMQCTQAHKGTLSIVDDAEFSGATFKVEIPLFACCMK